MIDYITDNLWQMWAAVAVMCLIAEISTSGFYIICFSVGALFSMTVSLLFDGFYLQLVVFIVCSAVSIFLVRPLALRWFHGGDENVRKTNADALIGRVGVVTQTIEAGSYGRVAVGGDDWKAESDSLEALPVGSRVVVTDRESVIVKVSKQY